MTRPFSFSAWLRQPQTVVALSALVLSMCGVFVAIYEASLIRRSQRAAVWPHVEIKTSLNPGSVVIRAQNVGVGPARVHALTLSHSGKHSPRWTSLAEIVGLRGSGLSFYQSTLGGRVLPADPDEETIFRVEGEASVTNRLARALLDGTVDLEVCYCSVYDECWVTALQDLFTHEEESIPDPRPVAECAPRPRSAI